MPNSNSVLSYVSTDSILLDSDEIILFISRTGTIILINNHGSNILGYPPNEITEMNWFNDFVPELSREQVKVEFNSGLSEPEKTVFTQDYHIVCSGKKDNPYTWHNRIVRDEDNIVMCILVSGHAVTIPEKPGDEIFKNQDIYRALIENSNDAIIIHKDGKIVFANDTAKRKTGYIDNELIGTEVLDHISPQSKPLVLKYMRDRIAAKEAPDIYDIEVLLKNGDIIPAEINVSLIRHDQELSYMVLLRDLSERQALEQQLRQAQKMDAVGQLAGGVAHDFNNILQIINGYTELAQASLNADDPVLEMLQQVSQAGERASTLVRQLLTFSRNQLIVTTQLDINSIIAEDLSMLKRVIGDDIVLDFQPSETSIFINGDQTMIGQILLNICLNSRDAMTGGGRIEVKTDKVFLDSEFCEINNPSAEQGDFALISISDNGCGMTPETLGRIFEPFFSTKGITAGTGLGLSTVYGIVIQHDGIVTASSEVDVGTTFRIYLPATEIQEEADGRNSQQVSVPEIRKTIIITEDDENVRNLASDILTDAGHEVITASNGEEAVLLVSDSPDSVDLMVLDVIMPVLGGYEAAERIREIRPDIPIIFCTGYSRAHNQKDIQRNLANSRFLLKPYSMAQLLNTINDLINENRQLNPVSTVEEP
jgi:two-component system, cell cycle sensor histidine kinase and response regulator CckA